MFKHIWLWKLSLLLSWNGKCTAESLRSSIGTHWLSLQTTTSASFHHMKFSCWQMFLSAIRSFSPLIVPLTMPENLFISFSINRSFFYCLKFVYLFHCTQGVAYVNLGCEHQDRLGEVGEANEWFRVSSLDPHKHTRTKHHTCVRQYVPVAKSLFKNSWALINVWLMLIAQVETFYW